MTSAVLCAADPTLARREAVAWYLCGVLVLVLYSPLLEYGSQIFRRFQDLEFPLYQLTDEEFRSSGSIRYLRDGLLLAAAAGGLLAPGLDRRAVLAIFGAEGLLIGLGTLGQVALPRLDVYACGLRWALNLHVAATSVLVMSRCSEPFWRRFRLVFGAFVAALAVLLLIGLSIQWSVLGFGAGIRLTSIFPQSEMVVEFCQAAAIYFGFTSGSRAVRAAWVGQLVVAGYFTATRMALLVAGLMIACGPSALILSRARRSVAGGWIGVPAAALVFLAAGAASLPLATLIAQRGPVLAQQLESARLFGWQSELHIADQQSLGTLLLGKGLGYRTTTAGILQLMTKYQDPYLEGHENGFAALFAQTGAVGLVLITLGMLWAGLRMIPSTEAEPRTQAMLMGLGAILLVLGMAGYWYEWPLFVQPVAVALAWLLRKPDCSTEPQRGAV